jgi:long-chain acyl-CoA synthetase
MKVRSLHIPVAKIFAEYENNLLLCDEHNQEIRYCDILELTQVPAFQSTCRRLVMCSISNDIEGIAGYLALLAANAVPMLISPTLPQPELTALIANYQPDFIWLSKKDASQLANAELHASYMSYVLMGMKNVTEVPNLHNDLALLLSTSGSTGSRKYIRLSNENVWSNAAAIAEYLALTEDEMPITTLPLSYSYGLSILHSHIWVGAGLAVTKKTFFEREFWSFLREAKATSLAGVPYHFEILKKLRFTKMVLPNLHTLTQAGGRMSTSLTQEFAAHCQITGMRFFTMYGQTEASPRMSYVPADQAFAKAGTIGIPIPGGALELQSEVGELLTSPYVVGEMVYRGPNVCLGYAEGRGDLLLGDVNCGILHTGDLAERDYDGYFRIVGRKKNFIKLFGNRVNLQDVEQQLSGFNIDLACSGRDDMLEVYLESDNSARALEIKKAVMDSLHVGAQGIAVYEVCVLPRNESGKVRYADLHPEKAVRLS